MRLAIQLIGRGRFITFLDTPRKHQLFRCSNVRYSIGNVWVAEKLCVTGQLTVPLLLLKRHLVGKLAQVCLSVVLAKMQPRTCKASVKTRLKTGHINSRPTDSCSNLMNKCKCLDLSEKVAIIRFARDHPDLGARKIAEHFQTGTTQIQGIYTCFAWKHWWTVSKSNSTQPNILMWMKPCVETLTYLFLDQCLKKRP